MPWSWRYFVLEAQCGIDFALARSDPMLSAYWRWFDHVMDLDCLRNTIPRSKEEYLNHIKKYADGSARSKVANAVRRGVDAHNFDDDKDSCDE